MPDDPPLAPSLRELAASGQGLIDHHVFATAVDETRMAMALADPRLPDCPLVYVNPAFTHITGYSPEDAVGRNCRFLQGPDTDPAMVGRLREAIRAREWFTGDIYNYRKDGTGFWNALHLSPVFDGERNLIYYFASQIDVSEQRASAQRQLRRMESMGALTSGVAHEFNNLMTVVVGSVERAAMRATDERQAAHLTRANEAARRAGTLATELLALAQRRTGNERVQDLNLMVRACENAMSLVGPARFDLTPASLPVWVDAAQLELVLTTLLRNARDAMDKDGEAVIATRALPSAEGARALGGEVVELSVSDTGRGMAPEILARSTELFFTTKQPGEGTGLGLFLALGFADQAGGKLEIESEVGRGTKVRLLLPRA